MKLRVGIEKDGSGYYVAEVPALPGCLSQGKTLPQARANILEAISGWVEVMNARAKKQERLSAPRRTRVQTLQGNS